MRGQYGKTKAEIDRKTSRDTPVRPSSTITSLSSPSSSSSSSGAIRVPSSVQRRRTAKTSALRVSSPHHQDQFLQDKDKRRGTTDCQQDPVTSEPIVSYAVCCLCGTYREEPVSVIYYCACIGRTTSAHASCVSSARSYGTPAKSHACEICSDEPVVNGRESASVRMPSKVETARVIDPDLNWKTDSKAPKSNKKAIRRARTALTDSLEKSPTKKLSCIVDLNDNASQRTEEMPVSESEKLGISVLGRRFTDTIVSVPIKKRRIPLVQPPSPPPRTPSPAFFFKKQSPLDLEETLANSDNDWHVSGDSGVAEELLQMSTTSRKVKKVHPSEPETELSDFVAVTGQCSDTVDFSGISMLAAAACKSELEAGNGSSEATDEGLPSSENVYGRPCDELDRGEQHVMVIDPKVQALNTKENAASGTEDLLGRTSNCSGPCNPCQNDIDNYEGHEMDSMDVLGSLNPKELKSSETSLVEKDRGMMHDHDSAFPHVDRTGWDLNTPMDEWRSPSDDVANMENEKYNASCSKELGDHLRPTSCYSPTEDTISLGKSELQRLDCNTEVSEGPAYPCQSCPAGCKSEGGGSKCLFGDISVVESDGVLVPSMTSDGTHDSSEKKESLDADTGPFGSTMVAATDLKGYPSEMEEHPCSSGITGDDTGLDVTMADPTKKDIVLAEVVISAHNLSEHICVHAEDDVLLSCGVERNVHGPPAVSHPSGNYSCMASAVVFREKADGVPDVDDQHLMVAKGSDSLVENQMSGSTDLSCPAVEKSSGNNHRGDSYVEQNCVSIVSADDNMVRDSSIKEDSLVRKITDDTAAFGDVENASKCEGAGSQQLQPETVVFETKEEECPRLACENIDSAEARRRTNQRNSPSISNKQDPTTREPVSVNSSSQGVGSESSVDEHVNCSLEDTDLGTYGSDYESDVSQKITELAAVDVSGAHGKHPDDDSQIEDGEFRELASDWDEDMAEDLEVEHLDYGSPDTRDIDDFDKSIEDHYAGSLQEESMDCKRKLLVESFPSAFSEDATSTEKKEVGVWDCEDHSLQADKGSGRANSMTMVGEVLKGYADLIDSKEMSRNNEVAGASCASRDEVSSGKEACVQGEASMDLVDSSGRLEKSLSVDCHPQNAKATTEDCHTKRGREEVDLNRPSAVEAVARGGSASSRRLSSRIEGPVFSDTADGKERRRAHENRFDEYREAKQVGRDTGRVRRSTVGIRGRGRGIDWLDSPNGYWGPNRHDPPTHYGPSGMRRMASDNAATVVAAKLHSSGFVVAPDGTIIRAGRSRTSDPFGVRSIGPSLATSRGGGVRRRSPTQREEGLNFGIQLGLKSVREISPDGDHNGGRSRSRGYGPWGIDPTLRERCREMLDDDGERSSLRIDYHAGRPERSFSPGDRNRISQSDRRSPRGRIAVQYDGEEHCLRTRSRSPNFRPRTRTQRIRSASDRPTHLEDFNNFAPLSRDCSSRDVVQFRECEFRKSALERISPGRVLPRSACRYDMLGSPRRAEADLYLRSPGLDDDDWGPRYDISKDLRRRQDERYRVDHPGRSYNTDAHDRHIQYNIDGGLQGRSSRGNAAEFQRRGSPKDSGQRRERSLGERVSSREEGVGHSRYGREERRNPNFKRFQIDDDHNLRSRRRPS